MVGDNIKKFYISRVISSNSNINANNVICNTNIEDTNK